MKSYDNNILNNIAKLAKSRRILVEHCNCTAGPRGHQGSAIELPRNSEGVSSSAWFNNFQSIYQGIPAHINSDKWGTIMNNHLRIILL